MRYSLDISCWLWMKEFDAFPAPYILFTNISLTQPSGIFIDFAVKERRLSFIPGSADSLIAGFVTLGGLTKSFKCMLSSQTMMMLSAQWEQWVNFLLYANFCHAHQLFAQLRLFVEWLISFQNGLFTFHLKPPLTKRPLVHNERSDVVRKHSQSRWTVRFTLERELIDDIQTRVSDSICLSPPKCRISTGEHVTEQISS